MRGLSFACAIALAAFVAAPAQATLYDWTYSGDFTIPSNSEAMHYATDNEGPLLVTGSGTVTVDDLTQVASAITGVFDGDSIIGLLAPEAFDGNDDIVDDIPPYLDSSGIAFSMSSGLLVNLYQMENFNSGRVLTFNIGDGNYASDVGFNDDSIGTNSVNGTFTLNTVPEPGTLALLGGMLLLMLPLLRRHGRAPRRQGL